MTINEELTDRIRAALEHVSNVEEKKMFRGITFMVNNKMCISVSPNEIMCRIGPEKYEEALDKKGCRPMVMKGREYVGYVLVDVESIKSDTHLKYWIELALSYNEVAKAASKKKKK